LKINEVVKSKKKSTFSRIYMSTSFEKKHIA
jgi:hypothetical protein